jgi:Leucine-rich repeat (LRR) protein
LTELTAYHNKLTTLPDSIAALTQMKTLHLFGNKFTMLPKPIGKLTSLTVLHLNHNKLVTLPDSIAALTALKTLILCCNPLAKPQSSAVEAWLTALRAGGCSLLMPF